MIYENNGRYSFNLATISECQDFERMLSAMIPPQLDLQALRHFKLDDAFKAINEVESLSEQNRRRLFSLLFDTKISFLNYEIENSEIFGTLNEINSHISNLNSPASVLENPDFFPLCFNLQRFAPIFAMRYRAIWDRLMSMIILRFANKELKTKKKSL